MTPRRLVPLALPVLALLAAACASGGATVRTADTDARAPLAAAAAGDAAGEQAMAGRPAGARTLGVLPFEPADTLVDDLAVGLAELLMADLGKLPGLALVERVRLDDVLREQHLDTARVDPATAVRVGRLVAAGQLVRGTLAAVGDTAIRFDVGLVDVATSGVSDAWVGSARATGIFAVERQLVARLALALGVAVPPEVDARLAARVAYPVEAFQAFARGARAEADGNLEAAAEAYDVAAAAAPSFDVAATKSATVKRQAKAKGAREVRPRRLPKVPVRLPTRSP
jgi:hypothetical protein